MITNRFFKVLVKNSHLRRYSTKQKLQMNPFISEVSILKENRKDIFNIKNGSNDNSIVFDNAFFIGGNAIIFSSVFMSTAIVPVLACIKLNLIMNCLNTGFLIGTKSDDIELDYKHKKKYDILFIKPTFLHLGSSFVTVMAISTMPLNILTFTLLFSTLLYNTLTINNHVRVGYSMHNKTDEKYTDTKISINRFGLNCILTNMLVFIWCLWNWNEFKKMQYFGKTLKDSKSYFQLPRSQFEEICESIEETFPKSIRQEAKRLADQKYIDAIENN